MKKRTEKAAKFQLPQAKILVFNLHGRAIELSPKEKAQMVEDAPLIDLYRDTWYEMSPEAREWTRWGHRQAHS